MKEYRQFLPHIVFATLGFTALAAQAEFESLWMLSPNDNSNSGLGSASNTSNVTPGSATVRDDDYYLAGTYAAPIGTLAASEPLTNFENSLRFNDPRVRIHFPLSAAQRPANASVRLIVDIISVSQTAVAPSTDTRGLHDVVFKLNGLSLGTWTVDNGSTIVKDIPVSSFGATNVIEIERAGPLNVSQIVNLDTVELQLERNGLLDSDNDGATNRWESLVGTNPTGATSTPPANSGVIGIKFAEEAFRDGIFAPHQAAGFYPQINWNTTFGYRNGLQMAGSTRDINSPNSRSVSDAAGVSTPTTFTWTGRRVEWTSYRDSPDYDLQSSVLTVDNTTPATFNIANIPFSNYEIVAHVGANRSIHKGKLTKTSGADVDVRVYTAVLTKPNNQWIEVKRTNFERVHVGNIIRFKDQTASSFNLKLETFNGSFVPGISAIQIIDHSVDHDSDGLSTAWELRHRLPASVAGTQLLDSDSDGLNNLGEFQRDTDPWNKDSDGDGLSDNVETKTGTYISATNTGSDPTYTDTDDDGLSDGDELNGNFLPSDPTKADSDNDGANDTTERLRRTDPLVSSINTNGAGRLIAGPPRSFDWEIGNLQVVRNNEYPLRTSNGSTGSDVRIIGSSIANLTKNANACFQMNIVQRAGKILYTFSSAANGAFYTLNAANVRTAVSRTQLGTEPSMLASLGWSGAGTSDISDRFSVKMNVVENAATGKWTLTFTIRNQDTNTVISTATIADLLADETILDGTAVFANDTTNRVVGFSTINGNDDNQIYLSTTKITNLPQFADLLDTDGDGMRDSYEVTYSLNKNSAADAALDGDGDTLTNYQEYQFGTDPTKADTDGDGFRDAVERNANSDPNNAQSRPPFSGSQPAAGEDFNGDGIADAWQARYGAFGLAGNSDNDGDGITNAQEAIAGTDPKDALSRLWSRADKKTNGLAVAWPDIPNKQHIVFKSTTLGSWANAGGSPLDMGAELEQTFTTAGSREFFRVHVSDKDTDTDGISDASEVFLGFDPARKNSARSAIAYDTDNNGTVDISVDGDRIAARELLQNSATNNTTLSRNDAARFLMQATFGPTMKDIDTLVNKGTSTWLNEQIDTIPASHTSPYALSLKADAYGAQTNSSVLLDVDRSRILGTSFRTIWARNALNAPDQLRQRVAYALSQILVISRRDSSLEHRMDGLCLYYDMLIDNAFGNYGDLLNKVTYNPLMGRYLSHAGNEKANAALNQFPDENYAREIMQLFSIGLWQLQPNGERVLDANGQSIPTYGTRDIQELARVMTGLWFHGRPFENGGFWDEDYVFPMVMTESRHDFGEKKLFNDALILPAQSQSNAGAINEINTSVRYLFNHPNTPPFVCKQLIQFLVTANPSPAYVQRVASKFINNGAGVRGDLEAVVRAILTDPDARNVSVPMSQAQHGHLREPAIRAMHMSKLIKQTNFPNLYWRDFGSFTDSTLQVPLEAPSVFNFYRPDYQPPGLLADRTLNGPVFSITNSYTAISLPNEFWNLAERGLNSGSALLQPADYSDFTSVAGNIDILLDRINLLACSGRMTASTRKIINDAVTPITEPARRSRLALYLAFMSPESAVSR